MLQADDGYRRKVRAEIESANAETPASSTSGNSLEAACSRCRSALEGMGGPVPPESLPVTLVIEGRTGRYALGTQRNFDDENTRRRLQS